MSYAEKRAEIEEYLKQANGDGQMNIEAVLAFLDGFSGKTLPGVNTLTTERLTTENNTQGWKIPEGVCRAIVLEYLRPKKEKSPVRPGRRLLMTDFRQMAGDVLVNEFAKDPFNPQSLAASALKSRAHNKPVVVFVGESDEVDTKATTILLDARIQGKPVGELYQGNPIFAVGVRPNEMVEIDPLRGRELTADGKDQEFGHKWGAVSEEMRIYVRYLVLNGHLTTKGLNRERAAQIYTAAKGGQLDDLAATYGGETVLRDFRIAKSAGQTPVVKVLRSSLIDGAAAMTDGLEKAVRRQS